MSIQFNIRSDEPLEAGAYRARLSEMRKTETPFGLKILWLYEVTEHNAEVAGFTSLSESTQANAYLWATALNPEIASRRTWGSDDVIGREAILDLTIGMDSKGRPKNKIVRVRPVPKDEVA